MTWRSAASRCPRADGGALDARGAAGRDARRPGGLRADRRPACDGAVRRPTGASSGCARTSGRHNALDKLIGASALAGELPLHGRVALVSGRVSFEVAQKAAVAGIAVLAAVSAPTDLAVATARRLGMTLVGFLRGRRLQRLRG